MISFQFLLVNAEFLFFSSETSKCCFGVKHMGKQNYCRQQAHVTLFAWNAESSSRRWRGHCHRSDTRGNQKASKARESFKWPFFVFQRCLPKGGGTFNWKLHNWKGDSIMFILQPLSLLVYLTGTRTLMNIERRKT